MWVVLIISILSVVFCSLYSVVFFISSTFLFAGMTRPHTERYACNIWVTIVNLLIWVFFVSVKVLYLISLKTEVFTDFEKFKDRVVFNELCGITTSYKDGDLDKYRADPDKNGGADEWKYAVDRVKSYSYDILVLLILVFTLYFLI